MEILANCPTRLNFISSTLQWTYPSQWLPTNIKVNQVENTWHIVLTPLLPPHVASELAEMFLEVNCVVPGNWMKDKLQWTVYAQHTSRKPHHTLSIRGRFPKSLPSEDCLYFAVMKLSKVFSVVSYYSQLPTTNMDTLSIKSSGRNNSFVKFWGGTKQAYWIRILEVVIWSSQWKVQYIFFKPYLKLLNHLSEVLVFSPGIFTESHLH